MQDEPGADSWAPIPVTVKDGASLTEALRHGHRITLYGTSPTGAWLDVTLGDAGTFAAVVAGPSTQFAGCMDVRAPSVSLTAEASDLQALRDDAERAADLAFDALVRIERACAARMAEAGIDGVWGSAPSFGRAPWVHRYVNNRRIGSLRFGLDGWRYRPKGADIGDSFATPEEAVRAHDGEVTDG